MDENEWDERISEDRYGCFTVLFSNVNSLTMDEIGEIFSQFGDYLSIRRAGNQCGIHFITYELYEQAKKAVEGLEDHPDIQLKVYRRKYPKRKYSNDGYNNNNNNDNYNNRWSNGCYTEAGQRANTAYRYDRTNRQFSGYNSREESYAESGREKFVNRRVNGNASDTECREISAWKRLVTPVNKPPTKKVASVSSDDHSSDAKVNQRECTENEKSFLWYNVQSYLSSLSNNQIASCETIDASDNTEGEQFMHTARQDQSEDEESELAAIFKTHQNNNSLTSQESHDEEVVVQASEVIVGNVDYKVNEAYLLYLFNKYEPIAVSQLVPLPRANVQYCYVYFKSSDVAKKVERSFDKVSLAGKQLVVQRPKRLIASYLQHI